jgi:hypothetical protein
MDTNHQTPDQATSAAKWDLLRVANVVLLVGIGLALALVVLAPASLSFQDLAGWGEDRLGLTPPWTYVVPVALDAAALVCVGLVFHATLRAESGGAARLLVWVLAGASATANYRQGAEVTQDAAVFFGAMPLLAALLLDLVLRRIRRTVLAHIGAVERPLPRYRAARWLVAPVETARAWRYAVKENVTNPHEALTLSRLARAGVPDVDPDDGALELPAGDVDQEPASAALVPDDTPPDLASWRKVDAVQLAFQRLGEINGGKAVTWLAKRDVIVNSNYAYEIARKCQAEQDEVFGPARSELDADRRPALAAVSEG